MTKRPLLDIFNAALGAADPYNAVKRAIRIEENRLFAGSSAYDLKEYNRIIVVGTGKGTAPMAQAVEEVLEDRLDVIASGPTVPDRSTFMDAVKVTEKYNLVKKLPDKVLSMLLDGIAGKLPDTPKAGEDCFKKGSAVIVGSLRQALHAARSTADKSGFDTEIVTDKLQGETREVAKHLAEISLLVKKSHKGIRPRCLLSGGETVVTVKGDGMGGRNQELALAFALEIEGIDGISLLSAGTDGTDGPTDAAGAIVDGETAALARKLGLDPVVYLENNDSYNFFKKLDSLSGERHHLITGPTGTNVMDMQIIIVEK